MYQKVAGTVKKQKEKEPVEEQLYYSCLQIQTAF